MYFPPRSIKNVWIFYAQNNEMSTKHNRQMCEKRETFPPTLERMLSWPSISSCSPSLCSLSNRDPGSSPRVCGAAELHGRDAQHIRMRTHNLHMLWGSQSAGETKTLESMLAGTACHQLTQLPRKFHASVSKNYNRLSKSVIRQRDQAL